MRTLARLALGTLVATFGAQAAAQPAWSSLSPANAPASRQDHNMVAAGNGSILLFGGSTTKSTPPLNDTWSWDGNDWTQLSPATSPTAVTGHGMAYDPARDRVVLFGGSTVPAGQVNYSSETWEWDGTDWTQMNPATVPPARDWTAMVYDPNVGGVLMFAGRDSNNKPAGSYVPYDDTWVWNGVDWTQLSPATVPATRHGHQMAFDKTLNKVVMTGGEMPGASYDETWTWDGVDWTLLTTANSPGIRVFHAMEYDDSRNVLVLHSGKNKTSNTLYGDTWEFDGSNWTQVDNSGPAYGWYRIAYDANNQEILVQGGSTTPNHSTSDGLSWSFGEGIWTNLGNGLAGSLGEPELSAQGKLAAGEVVALTLSNAAPNILVLIPTGPTGGYMLPGVYPAGVLAGIPLFFQCWVLDPTGPQGHTASNALTATTM